MRPVQRVVTVSQQVDQRPCAAAPKQITSLVTGCWAEAVIGPLRWAFPHSLQRCQQNVKLQTVASPKIIHPQGPAVCSQGHRMPYILISTQIRLVRIVHSFWVTDIVHQIVCYCNACEYALIKRFANSRRCRVKVVRTFSAQQVMQWAAVFVF